jgi:flagellar basal body L-ring protein FlgH
MADPTRVQGFLTGGAVTSPSGGQVLAIMVAPARAQMRTVVAACGASGGTATIIDVRNNGASVYTDPTHRPTLPAAKSGRFTSFLPDHRAVDIGDILTLVVVQAGGHSQVAVTAALEEP